MENESTATFMTNDNNNIDRIKTPNGIIYRIESTLSVEASDKANDAATKAETAATKAESAATSATEKASAANEAAVAANEAARKAEAASSGIASELAKKQDVLTAGDGISISGSTISTAKKATEIIPLTADKLRPVGNADNAVFIVKSDSACTLCVNGNVSGSIGMFESLIDDESSQKLKGLLPAGYAHVGTLNIQVASNVSKLKLVLEAGSDKPLTVQAFDGGYYYNINSGEQIQYTFTWAI